MPVFPGTSILLGLPLHVFIRSVQCYDYLDTAYQAPNPSLDILLREVSPSIQPGLFARLRSRGAPREVVRLLSHGHAGSMAPRPGVVPRPIQHLLHPMERMCALELISHKPRGHLKHESIRAGRRHFFRGRDNIWKGISQVSKTISINIGTTLETGESYSHCDIATSQCLLCYLKQGGHLAL